MNFVKLLKFAKVCGVITLLKTLCFCFVGGVCVFLHYFYIFFVFIANLIIGFSGYSSDIAPT